MTPTAIASWLLTYLIHSTILLAGAWLVSRGLGDRRLALQEIFLRSALVGGLLTASVQVGLGIEPLAGAIAIDTAVSAETTAPMTTVENDFMAASVVPVVIAEDAVTGSGMWAVALLTVWCVGSVLAVIGLGRSHVDLRRLLRTRRFRTVGQLVERLAAAMGLRRKIRLSTSQAIAVPFATGIRRPEICCPERVSDLAVEHQTGLFAHELAHLARRDPAWQLIYRLGEAIFILQPLNRLVRRRLEEIAEHLTDERAVACTGDRVGLARCLVVVAHWGVSSRMGVPATAFASGPRLDRRVRRLIAGSSDRLRLTPWAAPLLIAALIGAVSVLPVVAPAPVHAESSVTGSELVRVKTWSDADEAPPEALPPPPAPAPVAVPVAEPVPAAGVAPEPVATSEVEPARDAAPAPVPAAAPPPPADQAPPTPPTAATPPAVPEEKADRQEKEERGRREDERQRAKERERSAHEARERAEKRLQARIIEYEEQSRMHEVRAREMAEHAAQLAAKAAERAELTDEQRDELRLRALQLGAIAEARALENLARAEERARARNLAYEERVREFAARAAELTARAAEHERLSDEQRAQFEKQLVEIRAMVEARARERALATEERAREAAERARRLAERAEDERIAREEQRRQKEDKKE